MHFQLAYYETNKKIFTSYVDRIHDKEENNNYIGGRGRLVITPYIVVGKKTAERSRRLASPTKMDRFSEIQIASLSGLFAGFINSFVVSPVELVKT